MLYKVLDLTDGSYLREYDIYWQSSDRIFETRELAQETIDILTTYHLIMPDHSPKMLPCYFEILKV